MYSHHLSALAQNSTSASGSSSFPSIAFTLVILLLLLVRRVRGQELLTHKLIVLPFIPLLLGAGAVVPQLAASKSAPIHFHGIDYLVLFTDLALSVVIGSIRGFTVLIYPRNGATWYRYGPMTVLLWFLSIALRTLLGIIGAHHGALPLVTSGIVLFMFGLTLLIQNIVVIARRNLRKGSTGSTFAHPDVGPWTGKLVTSTSKWPNRNFSVIPCALPLPEDHRLAPQ